jgi:hypothetical protein
MCEEIGIHLSYYRSKADRDEMLQKWNELSTYNTSKHFLSFINLCYRFLIYYIIFIFIICNIEKYFAYNLKNNKLYTYTFFIKCALLIIFEYY